MNNSAKEFPFLENPGVLASEHERLYDLLVDAGFTFFQLPDVGCL